MIRYYMIKAYLNASHYVVFDGKRGDVHPHTWEYVAKVYTSGKDVVKFSEPERAVMSIFEPYQNKVMNEQPPFDAINPTLENMTEYFATQITTAVEPYGYHLRTFEGSETPVRTYGVEFPEVTEEIDDLSGDEVEAALGRLGGNIGK